MPWLMIGFCSLMNFAAGGMVYTSTRDVYLATATFMGLQSILSAIIARGKNPVEELRNHAEALLSFRGPF